MILYKENPNDATRKLLELINEFGKLAGYKINAQKSLEFLYTNSEKSEREIKETLPFTIATEVLFYSASVHLRTVIVVYFITIVTTNRNEELLIEQVINTDQTCFMSNRVGYNHTRLFTVMTKGTNIKDTNLFLTTGTKKSSERTNYISFSFLHYRIQFFWKASPHPELLILKKGKMLIAKILNLGFVSANLCVGAYFFLFMPQAVLDVQALN